MYIKSLICLNTINIKKGLYMKFSDFTKSLPLKIGITGRKRDLCLNLFEKLFSIKEIEYSINIGKEKLNLNLSYKNERLLLSFRT